MGNIPFILQGKIPAVFGRLPHLRELILSNNRLSGSLDDFSAAAPANSRLTHVELAHNHLGGPLFAAAITRLGVFSSAKNPWATEADLNAAHVFDLSYNKLSGALEEEFFQVRVMASQDTVSPCADWLASSPVTAGFLPSLSLQHCSRQRSSPVLPTPFPAPLYRRSLSRIPATNCLVA
jgi:hypothetical protein